MSKIETIREYNTRNFRVSIDAMYSPYPDLSWCDVETLCKIQNSELQVFDVRVIITLGRHVLAEEWLGECCEARYQDFLHGGYAREMVHEAAQYARDKLNSIKMRA
jgi:hypothetical protein